MTLNLSFKLFDTGFRQLFDHAQKHVVAIIGGDISGASTGEAALEVELFVLAVERGERLLGACLKFVSYADMLIGFMEVHSTGSPLTTRANGAVTATAVMTPPPSPSSALPNAASAPPIGCPLFDYTYSSSQINELNHLQKTTKCHN